MSESKAVKLTLTENEFRLLSDLVEVAGRFVNAGEFSRTITVEEETKSLLAEKLRKAGEESGIEETYETGLFWFQQQYGSQTTSTNSVMTPNEKLEARNNDFDSDLRDLTYFLLAWEQTKLDYFRGFKMEYQLGREIQDHARWFRLNGSELSEAWCMRWLPKYQNEYKKHGLSNLKFKLVTRLKMLFWSPSKTL